MNDPDNIKVLDRISALHNALVSCLTGIVSQVRLVLAWGLYGNGKIYNSNAPMSPVRSHPATHNTRNTNTTGV